MLDQSHIPSSTDNTQYFFFQGTGSNGYGLPQTWIKPRGASMVYIVCVGGGSGGNGARTSIAVANGGAGGASGCVQTGIYPASNLPDQLYVSVGPGGPGLAALNGGGTTGNAGSASAVFFDSGLTSPLIQSSTNALTTLSTNLEVVPFIQLGILPAFVASQAGGNLAVTNSINAPSITQANYLVMGGSGGGCVDSTSTTSGSGGDVIGPYGTFISGGISRGRGNDGITNLKPFYSTGGSGGGAGPLASYNAIGGNGGLGSGGGGSGYGSNNTSRGGNGGNGIVIITTI